MPEKLTCAKCGTVHVEGQLLCTKCGSLLFDPTASTLHMRVDPMVLRLRTKRFRKGGPVQERTVMMHIRGLVEHISFEEGTGIVLGRVDLSNPDPTRFDLTPYGGHERGVSREHALLRYKDSQLSVTDLNSVNGTLVNQQRLKPGDPQTLKDSDELILGSLPIVVRLDPGQSAETPAAEEARASPAQTTLPSAAAEKPAAPPVLPSDMPLLPGVNPTMPQDKPPDGPSAPPRRGNKKPD